MDRVKSFDEVYSIFGRKRRLMERLGKIRNLRKKSPADLDKSRIHNKKRLKKILNLLSRRKGDTASNQVDLPTEFNSPANLESAKLPDPEISRNLRHYLGAVYHMGRMLLNRLDIDERLKEQESKMLKDIRKFINKYNLNWPEYDVLRTLTHPSLDGEICHPWVQMLNDSAAVRRATEVRRDIQYERERLFTEIEYHSKRAYKRLRKRWEKINRLHLIVEKQEFDDLEERGLVNGTLDIICPHPWHDTIGKIASCPNVQYVERALVSYG